MRRGLTNLCQNLEGHAPLQALPAPLDSDSPDGKKENDKITISLSFYLERD